MRAFRPESGFSLVETMVASGLVLGLAMVIGSVFAATAGVCRQSKVVLQANEDQRRNLDALANLLRAAASDTFSGFSANGTSAAPSFQCVTGADAAGRTLDATQVVTWRANGDNVPGLTNPGELVVTKGGVATVIARRVPGDGFLVTLLGSTLKIELTTYAYGSDRRVATVSGEVAIALRN